MTIIIFNYDVIILCSRVLKHKAAPVINIIRAMRHIIGHRLRLFNAVM